MYRALKTVLDGLISESRADTGEGQLRFFHHDRTGRRPAAGSVSAIPDRLQLRISRHHVRAQERQDPVSDFLRRLPEALLGCDWQGPPAQPKPRCSR